MRWWPAGSSIDDESDVAGSYEGGEDIELEFHVDLIEMMLLEVDVILRCIVVEMMKIMSTLTSTLSFTLGRVTLTPRDYLLSHEVH